MIDQETTFTTIKLLAAQALREYSIEALLPMLEDSDPIVRTLVARELQVRGGEEVFCYAKKLSASRRFEHREIAAFLLGQLGTPHLSFRKQSLPLLEQLLDDEYFEVKGAAIAALGHLKASQLASKIICLASSDDDYVRENVAFALSCIDLTKDGLKVLRKLKKDNNPDVSDWAEFALKEYKRKSSDSP